MSSASSSSIPDPDDVQYWPENEPAAREGARVERDSVEVEHAPAGEGQPGPPGFRRRAGSDLAVVSKKVVQSFEWRDAVEG
jgi:hypothetical protein